MKKTSQSSIEELIASQMELLANQSSEQSDDEIVIDFIPNRTYPEQKASVISKIPYI